jgi:transcriptional regulator with XRE-family HTH domain
MVATVGENLFIGAQVAYWRRRRGKSQRVLADLAGMSQPYLSQIERGRRPVDRRATLVALANALQVSVADLTGKPGEPSDPGKASAAASVPQIREALIRREVGELTESHLDVSEALRAGEAYDFAALAPMLPDLLGGVRGPDFIQVAHVASYTLRDLGYPDLGRDAARLALAEARELGRPEWIGIAEWMRILSMPPEMPGAPARLAQRVADEIQPHTGDPQVRQAYGMLHLTAGLRSAVARDRDAALDHLGEARDAADSLGEPEHLGLARMVFGPTNVGFWTVAMRLELNEPELALEAAADLTPERVPLASRQGPFHADVATALAAVGRDDEAIAAFLRSEAVGPQWFRLRPTVRDTIGSIVRRTRRNAISKQMRHAAVAANLHQLVKD